MRKPDLFIPYTLLVSVLIINFYILGRYSTPYALGIFLFIPIFILAILSGATAYFTKEKKFSNALKRFATSLVVLLVVGALGIKLENYSSPMYLIIPSDYSGTVYLFATQQINDDHITVDKNGIAYINLPRGRDFRIKQGWRDISYAYNKALSYDVVIDKTANEQKLMNVVCFDVIRGKRYKNTVGPFQYNPNEPCVDSTTYWQWVDDELLDSSQISLTHKPILLN